MKRIAKKVFRIIIFVLLVFVGAFVWYVWDDYDATNEALQAFNSNDQVKISGEDPVYFQTSQETDTAIIFYPGGKVEEEAYGPLMQELAQRSIATFLVDMPFNLAVFGIDKAEDIIANHPEITDWYLAGHSLGGAMAAIYAEKNSEQLEGLILLASYSTADLSSSNLRGLSIYGSQDQVIDLDKLADYRPMLPLDTIEEVIEGGNHASFAYYGPQKGDGQAEISRQEQIEMTVDLIESFIKQN